MVDNTLGGGPKTSPSHYCLSTYYDAGQSQCGLRVVTRKTVFSNNAGHAPVMESAPPTFLLTGNVAKMSIPDPRSVNWSPKQ
ncbi:hypothetical protein SPHINGOT1_640032 [Sphingomonas sp. T1]|nr:hypothetical protein SPHINGOT1_640032 [Sphingomonas sp. T1]